MSQLMPSLIVVSPNSYPADNTSRTMELFGSNFVSSDTLTFIYPDGSGHQNAHAITFVSSNEIDYSFDDAGDAGPWSVRVNTADGTLHSSYQSFAVATAAPSLSSISPTSYPADNTTRTMALFGSNLASGDTVTLVDPQGDVYANKATTYVSSGELEASFNDGADPGTWKVEVNSSSGSSSYVSFAVATAAPSLSSISPTSYPADNTTRTMALFGSNLASGDMVTLVDPQGDVYANKATTYVSSGELEASFNDGADPGTWKVEVNSSSGSSSYVSFAVATAAPSLSSISPTSYPADNTTRTMALFGSNLASGDTVTLVDPQGDVYANKATTYVSSGELEASFNDGADPGTWKVEVNSSSGSSSYVSFAVATAAPSLSSISPTSYPADNTTRTMALFGSNLASGDTVTLVDPQGDVYANKATTYVSSGELEASFNDGADPGTWKVEVNSSSGSSSYVSFAVATAAPSLSSISPTSYPADNTTRTMALFGSNLASGDTVTLVDPQGDVYANKATTYVSSGELEASFNDGADPGTWKVEVNSSSGSSSYVSFAVATAAPSLSSISPTSYPADNTTRTMALFGSNLASGDMVTLVDPQGDVYANKATTYVSSGELEASFNDGADPGTWKVEVNSSSGSSSYVSFAVATAAPSLSSISPTSYPADNTTRTMALFGSNLASGDTVTLVDPQGDVYANKATTYVSSGELEASFNDGADPGTWKVEVNSSSGSSSYVSFAVAPAAPSLSSISPTSYPADNTTRTMALFGSNLASGDTVTLVDPQGDVYANKATTYVSSGELEASFNDGADPGTWKVEVNSSAGSSSYVSFAVATAAPSLSSISPTSYPADNTTCTMALFGSNLASGDTVTFVDPQGDVYANRATTYVSSGELEASFNDGADPGTWKVEVNSSAGSSSYVSFAVATPLPSFSISNAGVVTEGNDAVFMVTMNQSITAPNTIWYSTFAGTASAADGDYPNTYVDQPLTFEPNGSNTQQIVIPTYVSQNVHPDTFSVGLQSTETGGAFTSGTATIVANSGAPSFSISNAGMVTEGNNAVFTVTMSGSISVPDTIWYSTYAGTASAAHGDYPGTYVDQALTFVPGGSNTQQIVIPTYVTQNAHPDTFSVGLQSTQTGGAFTTGSATIVGLATAPPTPTAAPPVSDLPAALLATSAQPIYDSLLQQASPNLTSYLDSTDTSITTPELTALSPQYKPTLSALNDNLDSADKPIGALGDALSLLQDPTDPGTIAGLLLQTPIVKNLISAPIDQGLQLGLSGLGVYLAFAALAAASAPADIAVAAGIATVAGVDFGLQALQAATSASIGADPPDSNYQQVFVPSPVPVDPMPAIGLPSLTAAARAAITDIDQATQWMEAVDITENRYATALAAGDANDASMQYVAFLNDIALYMGSAQAANADLPVLSGQLQANGIGTQPVTAQQLSSALAEVQTQSNSEGNSLLESLGFTDAEIQTMDQEAASETIPTVLPSETGDEALANLASDFSTVAPVVIQTNGSTSLVGVGSNFFLDAIGSSDSALQYQGKLVTAGQFGANVAPIGAMQTATGYEVAWGVTGANEYIVWNTDSNGNYTSAATGLLSGTSYVLEDRELSFGEDLNGDGTTGPTTTQIASNDVTRLVQFANQYALENSSGGIAAWLEYQGSAVTVGQFGAHVSPIGAKQTATGYEVAWGVTGADEYIVWNTDSNGNYTSAATGLLSGTSATLEAVEANFGDSVLSGAGPIASTTTLATNGTTTLAQVGNLYELNPAGGGTGPLLQYQGSLVTAGQFGANVVPIGAMQTATGYEVAWGVIGADEYIVWNTDSNGNYTSAATGLLSGTSATLEAMETNFGDGALSGAGPIASTTTIATNGTTTLAQVGNLYELNPAGGGTGPLLQYQGKLVTAGQFGANVVPIGAMQTATGYEVAWGVTGANEYIVWNTDSNGNYTSAATGLLSGTSYVLEDRELSFGEDLNGDGTTGPTTTQIASNDVTRLVQFANQYALENSSGGIAAWLEYQGSAVTVGQFGAHVSPIGAKQTATGYEVAWGVTGADEYIVWNTDSNGNYTSAATGLLSGTSATLEAVEANFGDSVLSGAGPIASTTTLATNGTTTLAQVGNLYELNPAGGGTGPLLQYQGSLVTAGQFGANVVPIGAMQTATGYEVAWGVIGADEYIVWNTDSNGNYTSAATGLLSGTSATLEAVETNFGDGALSDAGPTASTTTIATNGTTTLAQVGNLYELNPAGGGTGPLLQYQGKLVTAGQFGANVTPIGAMQTATGYEVAWDVIGANEYIVWNTDSNGNYTSTATGLLSGTSATLEAVETNFGDGVLSDAGPTASTTTIATNGTTTLAQVGNLYELNPAGGGTGPLLQYQGKLVTAGQFGANVAPIGAMQTATGYEVAWGVTGANEYIVWNTDSNGNYTSAATGLVSGQSFALEDLEPAFGEDLNGDGRLSAALVTTTGAGNTLNLAAQTQATTINLGSNTASACAGLNTPSLAFIGTPDAITLGADANTIEYALAPGSGIETIANFVYGQDELNIDLMGAANGVLQAYNTTVGGAPALTIASSADPTHGLVLLNVPTGDTAAILLASHTTFSGGHALIS